MRVACIQMHSRQDVPAQVAAASAEFLYSPVPFIVFTEKDHWEGPLRARASENACDVLAPAQVGEHPPGRRC